MQLPSCYILQHCVLYAPQAFRNEIKLSGSGGVFSLLLSHYLFECCVQGVTNLWLAS